MSRAIPVRLSEAQPAEGPENGSLRLGGASADIRVFNPEDELAAILPGEAIVEKSQVGRSHMRIACG